MPLFDSPFERCPRCNAYVLLDQTARECAEEHHCELDHCPLAPYFEQRETPDEGTSPTPSLPVDDR